MADIKDQLRHDLTDAMRAKDEVAKTTLRAGIAAIQNAEVAGDEARELSHDEELAVLTKQVRQRRDSAEAYAQAGRQDLADAELAEAEILQRYLPKPLSDDEVKQLVAQEVEKASQGGEKPTMKQMGAIVRAVNDRAAGRAEGKVVAQAVKAALS